MALIFTTEKDSPYDVEVAGVGVLRGQAQGGIPVSRAAEVLPELQDPKSGEPLTGRKLETAAEAFAEARGIATKSLKNVDEEKLRVESGAFPAGPTIEEISRAYGERERGQVLAHAEVEGAPALHPSDVPEQETAVLPPTPGQED